MVFHVDGRLRPHDADNKATIYKDKRGMLWVTHDELLECGYRGLEDFDVVYLNGKFYELQGFVKEAGSWWIEEIAIDEAEISQEASEISQGTS